MAFDKTGNHKSAAQSAENRPDSHAATRTESLQAAPAACYTCWPPYPTAGPLTPHSDVFRRPERQCVETLDQYQERLSRAAITPLLHLTAGRSRYASRYAWNRNFHALPRFGESTSWKPVLRPVRARKTDHNKITTRRKGEIRVRKTARLRQG